MFKGFIFGSAVPKGIFKAMDDSGDGLLSEEEMSEWLMDESHLTLNSAFEMGKCLYNLSLSVVDSAVPVRAQGDPNKITQHSKNESVK